MDEKKVEGGKPGIDKEYLKKLAEKIKAEKAKKEGGQQAESSLTPPPPPPPPRPTSMPKPPAPPAGVPLLGDDEDEGEGMAAEKTAIIDLASLSGQNADARIIIMDGKDEGKALELTRDEIVAGRSLDNDFVISDISVSRKHFKIVRDTDGFKAEDMGSGNGIRVNGKKETSVVLFDGDLITAGARTIKFEILNETLKGKYSRKTIKAAEAGGEVVVKSRTPVVAWIAILMVFVVGGGGFYLFYTQQQQQQALQLKLEQEDTLDNIDQLIEEKNFVEAEKLIDEFLFKYPGIKTREVTKNKDLAQKEKAPAANFEQGRKRLAENKPEEAEGFFKLIPDDSLFYPEMVALIGKEKVEGWAIALIEELIKANKTDEAVRKISALLVEDPANQKANELMASLKAQVGAQKVETIQTTVAKEKEEKKKEQAQEQAEREKRKQELISKGKIKAKPKPRPVVVKKPEPKPVVETKAEYTMDDIQSAIDTFVSKDFDGAVARLELAAGGADAKVSKKAKDLVEKIKKFKKAYDDKDSKKAIIFDKQISGGKLKSELADLKKDAGGSKKSTASEDEFASGGGDSGSKKSSGGGDYDEAKAKTLYMEAVSLKESDPDQAKKKFKEVLTLVPADNKYYKKAKKALKE
ncbi:MAG TPA: FHA domain-containing protein [bacterium]|nr:FHA domain-containing protein [bacterium]